MAFERSKEITRSLKRELIVYQRVLRDKRTPVIAKLFLAFAIGYLLVPFDLIPDFIPVIGHFDDIVIIPVLVVIALRFIPREIIEEHRKRVSFESQTMVSPLLTRESQRKWQKRARLAHAKAPGLPRPTPSVKTE